MCSANDRPSFTCVRCNTNDTVWESGEMCWDCERKFMDTRNIICPYCEHIHKDSYEIGSGGEEDNQMECYNCEQPFFYSRNITVSYYTSRTDRYV